MILEQLRLNITREAYIFTPLYEPAKGNGSATRNSLVECLTIHRDTGRMELNAPPIPTNGQILQEVVVYGIMGFIQLHAGEYMIVITGYERVGSLKGSDILRATTFQILPLPHNLSRLSETQIEEEQTYVHLLQDHLRQNTFYYSYTYDLTRSIQRQSNAENISEPMWKMADPRFFWNRYLVDKMIMITESGEQDLSDFILPVIQGFVDISSTIINNHPVVFGLISRRSRERAGTRYFSRGLDDNGHASNFVETEQLLFYERGSAGNEEKLPIQLSFVQTRGSVPGIWGQITNTRYTPQLWVEGDLNDHHVLDTSRTHFNEQTRIYGSQILVNLVNKKGYEYPVGQLYARIVDALANPQLTYIHFDFHHECRKMRWDRVQLLIDELEILLTKQGYCCIDPNATMNKKRSIQTSVVRTNCMDCLDRTNVVQSALARWVLNRQLHDMGVLSSTQVIEDDAQFMTIFNNTWADNADVLSLAYSGTGALKTDYTRTGKRTYVGALNDLSNSLTRYVKNNYMDGSRQDGIDLFLGMYTVESGLYNSPFAKKKPWTTYAIPVGFFSSLGLFLMVLFSPEQFSIESSTLYVLLLSFCFALSITCWRYIQQHGTEFVDWPKLKPILFPNERVRSTTTTGPIATNMNGTTPTTAIPPKEHGIPWMMKNPPPERSNTAILDEAEQGYELPKLKKTT
ncbi:SacI homology domain-containing protein [Phascolomyces articulosus]|uniref:SacI homology domain-containing protein n=1 Tax=Phascolomyces articulosus TaxID=60185 RepID=A0AAD5K692_9FUNG|nr:SacI homology domain-containing protein [Phascolomyces articulosus]